MSRLTVFHGSNHIVKKPEFAKGVALNDFGVGFYCTIEKEDAREWACKNNTDGFVNAYELETDGLRVLNLLDGKHSVLNWIAILLQHRIFTIQDEIASVAKEYLISHFAIDTSEYDIIIGYRADDSYFSYAQSFIANTLPLRGLSKALRPGKLGSQTVLVSKKAFECIKFIGAEAVNKNTYYPKFKARDEKARTEYREEIRGSKSFLDDIYVMDILRGEVDEHDPRIQQIVFE